MTKKETILIPGTSELIIIFAVLVLLFGANKLPRLGGAIGESIKNFKKGLRNNEEHEKIESQDKVAQDKPDHKVV